MQKVLFLGLKVFSATGGIEKVCRVAGKALNDSFGDNFSMLVLHDDVIPANAYMHSSRIKGFKGLLPLFFKEAILKGRNSDTILLSHINLLPAGWLIKKIYPRKRLIVFIHGIEVWEGVKGYRKKMLNSCNRFIAVSSFTAHKFSVVEGLPLNKITVLNNCLDPFLPQPMPVTGQDTLLTLTRIAFTERNKGYDAVIRAMAELKEFPNLKYIIAGKYTGDEYERIKAIARECGVWNRIELPGYIADQDLPGLFSKGTVYIMPSIKEGFGIVFVEAMYYGLPVISSDADGSADALQNGDFGIMVKPGNSGELCEALRKVLSEPTKYIAPREKVLSVFGFKNYSKKLLEIVNNEQG